MRHLTVPMTRLDPSAEGICEVTVAGRQLAVGERAEEDGDASTRVKTAALVRSASGLCRQFEGTLKNGFGVEVVVG